MGAKAGIGVGVVVACLALAIGILVLIHRRRNRSNTGPLAEMEGTSGTWGRHNLDSTPIFEAHPHAKPAEADSNPRAELEGD